MIDILTIYDMTCQIMDCYHGHFKKVLYFFKNTLNLVLNGRQLPNVWRISKNRVYIDHKIVLRTGFIIL